MWIPTLYFIWVLLRLLHLSFYVQYYKGYSLFYRIIFTLGYHFLSSVKHWNEWFQKPVFLFAAEVLCGSWYLIKIFNSNRFFVGPDPFWPVKDWISKHLCKFIAKVPNSIQYRKCNKKVSAEKIWINLEYQWAFSFSPPCDLTNYQSSCKNVRSSENDVTQLLIFFNLPPSSFLVQKYVLSSQNPWPLPPRDTLSHLWTTPNLNLWLECRLLESLYPNWSKVTLKESFCFISPNKWHTVASLGIWLWVDFTNMIMCSFYTRRSQKRKNSVELSVSTCTFGIFMHKSCA